MRTQQDAGPICQAAGLTVQARAKLNLSLDVLGRREDGYHEMYMVMHSVELCDQVTLRHGEQEGVRVRCSLSFLPQDDRNLAALAAYAFWRRVGMEPQPLEITLDKVIPVCAGLAGGSSDAAAVLRGMNELYRTGLPVEELCRMGQEVGSDVPYCVLGGTALAQGRGEELTPLPPLPPCRVVLAKPDFSVSTPALFSRLDGMRLRRRPDTRGLIQALEAGDLGGVARRMYNVFEDVLPRRSAAKVEQVKQSLIQAGALGAAMSGTGSAVFGLFDGEEMARQAAEELRELCPEVFLTQSV